MFIMEKPRKKEKIERTQPIQNESYHGNIVSSDFHKAKPVEWKYMEGGANMHFLLSNEYQRMWMDEHRDWYSKRHPPKKEPVNIVRKYVEEFKEKTQANGHKTNIRLCRLNKSDEKAGDTNVNKGSMTSTGSKAKKNMKKSKSKVLQKHKSTTTEDLPLNGDSITLLHGAKGNTDLSVKDTDDDRKSEVENTDDEQILSPKATSKSKNEEQRDNLDSVRSSARSYTSMTNVADADAAIQVSSRSDVSRVKESARENDQESSRSSRSRTSIRGSVADDRSETSRSTRSEESVRSNVSKMSKTNDKKDDSGRNKLRKSAKDHGEGDAGKAAKKDRRESTRSSASKTEDNGSICEEVDESGDSTCRSELSQRNGLSAPKKPFYP